MRYLPTITWLFVAILLISWIVSTKIVQVWSFSFDGGTLLFPLSYIFWDILTEVYWYKESRKTIRIWLISMILMSVTIMLVGTLPSATDRTLQSAYTAILMTTPRIFIASIIAYFAWEFTNSYILAKLKIKDKGNYFWKRAIWSTIIWQAIDTVLFVVIAFWWVLSNDLLWMIILSNYIFKVWIEILFMPLTSYISDFLKRNEWINKYDKETNFNPFKIS